MGRATSREVAYWREKVWAQGALLQEAHRRQETFRRALELATARATRHPARTKDSPCARCGQTEHGWWNCTAGPSRDTCRACERPGHRWKQCELLRLEGDLQPEPVRPGATETEQPDCPEIKRE